LGCEFEIFAELDGKRMDLTFPSGPQANCA